MRKDRLLKVVEVLEDVSPSWFELDYWYCRDKDACKTTGCAIGWAAANPWFQARGLCLETTVGNYSENGVPIYKGLDQFDAIQSFFGLTNAQANYLFDPTAYRGKPGVRRVAERIRQFVKTGGVIDWKKTPRDFVEGYKK